MYTNFCVSCESSKMCESSSSSVKDGKKRRMVMVDQEKCVKMNKNDLESSVEISDMVKQRLNRNKWHTCDDKMASKLLGSNPY